MKTILRLVIAAAVILTAMTLILTHTQEKRAVFDMEIGSVGTERQRLISLGQSSESISVSWKGDKYGPGCFRAARRVEDLPGARIIHADKSQILGSPYYRYSVEIEYHGKSCYEIGDGINFDSPQQLQLTQSKLKTKFLFLGDIQLQQQSSKWQKMTKKAYSKDCSFALLGGDMVNVPTDLNQWEAFLQNCQALNGVPIMAAPGNHEGVHSNRTYKKIFRLPRNGPEGLEEAFYYFDYGTCRIIVLDSSFFTQARKQSTGRARWNMQKKSIERWLARAMRDSEHLWNIAVIHHPPYGMHDDKSISQDLREAWVPVLEKGRADLVLSGHQHLCMRTRPINGIVYMMGNSGVRSSSYFDGLNKPFYTAYVSSEAGYQVIEAGLRKLEITSYNKKGRILDATVIKKSLLTHVFEFFGGN